MDIRELVRILKSDNDKHEQVDPPFTDERLAEFERNTKFVAPPSFAIFLKEFGSGAYWLYGRQPIDSAESPAWLRTYRPNLPNVTEIFGGGNVPTDSLLCLMSEDSNGGAWCWLPTLRSIDGECPLAYWDMASRKLHYQVSSFAKWLEILIINKDEVIRVLDNEELLGLG